MMMMDGKGSTCFPRAVGQYIGDATPGYQETTIQMYRGRGVAGYQKRRNARLERLESTGLLSLEEGRSGVESGGNTLCLTALSEIHATRIVVPFPFTNAFRQPPKTSVTPIDKSPCSTSPPVRPRRLSTSGR